MSGPGADIRPGNALPLRNIPVGTVVHAVELKPGAGAKMARSAGTGIQLLAKEGGFATLRLPSGEIRLVESVCRATVGDVGNPEHELISLGKAGRTRWRDKRPVRPRRCHEPGRPPAGRRRGQVVGRPPSHQPLGQEGRPHAQAEQGVGQVDRPPPRKGAWQRCRVR